MNNVMKKIVFGIALIGSMLSFGEETYTFTNPDEVGTFTIPNGQYAKVEMLLVGGGGAGGTIGQDINQGAAGGGGAGGVSHREVILEGGTYFVNVGRGGQKAQDLTHSWVGDDGEYTTLAFNNSTNFIATVKGGGGGGSVKNGGQGTPGASGGGGSWYGEFMNGGSGTDGYGWNGGTPTDINIGGGGGGAGSTGKADGTPGDGKEVWNVIYARGGRGGNRGEQNYEPKDGEGYGFGGDGAVNGLGGKGGDGIVIVKIIKTFTYTDVKIPVDGEQGYTFAFPSNGTNRIGFDIKNAPENLKNGIEFVGGVTNAVELGQYKFTVYLKEEYRWEDGTTDPKTFGWRINEPNVVGNITVDVKKTVDWFEGTNATIAIDIHSTPEKKIFVPRVLMLGSLCGAHGLSSDVINAAINAVTKVGDIDWYFFSELNSKTVTSAFSGSLKKGQTRTGQVKVGNTNLESETGNHGTLYEFYDQLAKIINEINKGTREDYDYIIFSFDRSLVASSFIGQHTSEATVVNWVKKFYDNNTVIWLVDKEAGSDEKLPSGLVQTPWAPSPVVWVSGSSYNYWTTLDNYVNRWGNSSQKSSPYGYRAYNAMLGLFDPYKYNTISQTSYGADSTQVSSLNATQVSRINRLTGTAIDNQVIYDNATNVAHAIEQVVKPTVATIEAHDQIYIKNGLKINSDLTDAYYTTNALLKDMTWEQATSSSGWTKLNSNELKYSDENGIELAISNVTSEAWVKLKIGVTDTGKFLTSVGAKWNERTGKWEKDPNNGPVRVEMMPDNGTKVIAEDEATTTVEWSFEAFKITGNVLYGEGDFIINGFETNEISVAKGYNPEAMFRGAPGWAVCYIEVDGQIIDDNHYMTNWFFGQISSDHDIKVAFTNIMVNPPPPEVGPTTQMYDGEGHTLEVLKDPTFLDGYEEYSNHWYMVYTTDPNADPTDRSAWTSDGVVTNVGTTTVYARVCLEQPGYEDGAIVPYWVGTNTVTIAPRPIEITIDDQWQTSGTRIPPSDFTYEQISGSLVDGDEIVIDYSCTYPSQGKTAPINGIVKIVHRNEDGTTTDVTDNYVIKVNPGTYHYPPANQVVATAPNIVKIYDGVKTNTIVTILNPDHTPTADEIKSTYSNNRNYNYVQSINETKKIEYLVKGEWTTTMPTFTDVGEYDVKYRVSYSYTFQHSRYEMGWLNPGTTDTVTYTPYEGTAKVTINKRDVVVTAGSS